MRLLDDWLRAAQRALVPVVRPKISRVFDHDPGAFTQGLVHHAGRLFESTGGEGRSSLREVDPSDGRVLRQLSLEQVFAEDLCLHDGSLLQLTWRDGRVFRYSIDPFAVRSEYRIDHEGWGIACVADRLWVSDGSSRLRCYDGRMRLQAVRRVSCAGLPVRHINALCAVGDRLYANLWYSHWVAEIDPQAGRLVGLMDCSALVAEEAPGNRHHVLNGIAFDAANHCLLLTGKHWKRCFEVQLPVDRALRLPTACATFHAMPPNAVR